MNIQGKGSPQELYWAAKKLYDASLISEAEWRQIVDTLMARQGRVDAQERITFFTY